jgi:hypothetical protein
VRPVGALGGNVDERRAVPAPGVTEVRLRMVGASFVNVCTSA